MKVLPVVCAVVLLLSSALAYPQDKAAGQSLTLDIAAQPLGDALNELGRQSGLQIVLYAATAKGLMAPHISGQLTATQALERLLANTGLEYEFLSPKGVAIRASSQPATAPDAAAMPEKTSAIEARSSARLTQTEPPANPTETVQEFTPNIPEILVTGSKSLNMDIRRTEDDARPYTIFDRQTIEQSAAPNLEEFLKTRLTMNTQGATNGQFAGSLGNTSEINLRGLGPKQTLILIDGHRAAGTVFQGIPTQPDLNGIPISAVERIEVLPTTASAIYGGGATGGVINIILRRDYSGLETRLDYDNSFDTDSGVRTIDANAGFNLEDGKTNVLMSASYSDGNSLAIRDRHLVQAGQRRVFENSPGFFLDSPLPPTGATTNIRSLDGSPLFGPGTSAYASVPIGYTGGGGLAPFQSTAGEYNLDLPNSAQSTGLNRSLLTATTTKSASLTLRREFTPHFSAFLEASASTKQGKFQSNSAFSNTFLVLDTAPGNPFGQPVFVTLPLAGADGTIGSDVDNYHGTVGGILRLPRRWSAEVDYTWNEFRGRSSAPDVFDADGSASGAILLGDLDVFRDFDAAPVDLAPYLQSIQNGASVSHARDAVLRLAGPIGTLPAGEVVLTTLVETRDETFGETRQRSFSSATIFPAKSQSIDSVYMEARVPFISQANAVRAAQELELELAARYDSYSVDGAPTFASEGEVVSRYKNTLSSTNPTIALRYRPLRDVAFRASFGTGFLPPDVTQLAPTINGGVPFGILGFLGLVDPLRGNTPIVSGDYRDGGNPDLKPEESRTWSLGTILTPQFTPGLRLSVDYSRIRKTDNIGTLPGGAQALLDSESVFGDRIVRGDKLPGDPADWAGVILSLDNTYLNIARAKIEAYDVQLDYHLDTASAGAFDVFSSATWQTHFETRAIDGAPEVENVGVTSSNPLKLKANFGLSWSQRELTLGSVAHYFDGYDVSTNPQIVANQGSARVSSQTYCDLFAAYRVPSGRGGAFLNNVEFQLNVRNVFNRKPPFDAGAGLYYSPFGDPRLSTYSLSVKKTFDRLGR